MIVALLILIVFILLFGAAAVKGFLANAASLVFGVVVLLGLLLWVGSFFGPNGFEYVVFGTMGLMLLLAIWVGATGSTKGSSVRSSASKVSSNNHFFDSQPLSNEDRKRLREAHRIGPRENSQKN